MNEKTFQFTSQCTHLSGVDLSLERAENNHALGGAIALVAIGNPLVERDAKAAALLTEFSEPCDKLHVCTFIMDSGFAWLPQILKQHDHLVVLDTIFETLDSHKGWIASSLTPEIIRRGEFVLSASHGLSWLDELQFALLHGKISTSIHFLGISSQISASNWNQLRADFMHVINRLCEHKVLPHA